MKKIKDNYFINKRGVDYNPSLENIVFGDEKILWKGKPLRTSFMLSAFCKMLFFVILWLAFDSTVITMICMFVPNLEWWMILILCVFFAFHLIPVWMWIANIITASKRQKLEEYAFTDKRIIVKKGFIGANIQSFYYSSITSINIHIGVIERLCKVGDIYIVADSQKTVLEDITDPYFIYDRLQAIANDIKNDIIYPNFLRKADNSNYKTSYQSQDDYTKEDKKDTH